MLKKDLSSIDLVPIRGVFFEVLASLVALVHKIPNAVQKLLYFI